MWHYSSVIYAFGGTDVLRDIVMYSLFFDLFYAFHSVFILTITIREFFKHVLMWPDNLLVDVYEYWSILLLSLLLKNMNIEFKVVFLWCFFQPPKIKDFISSVTAVPLENIEETLKGFFWDFDKVYFQHSYLYSL